MRCQYEQQILKREKSKIGACRILSSRVVFDARKKNAQTHGHTGHEHIVSRLNQICARERKAARQFMPRRFVVVEFVLGVAKAYSALPVSLAISSAKSSSRFSRPSPLSKHQKPVRAIFPPSSFAVASTYFATVRESSLT